MNPEQVARVEALTAAIPVVLARRDEDWPEFAGRTARAIEERLSEAGYAVTRVGDEERLRAALSDLADQMDTEDVMKGRGLSEFADELRTALAPQPPSPASQGEKG